MVDGAAESARTAPGGAGAPLRARRPGMGPPAGNVDGAGRGRGPCFGGEAGDGAPGGQVTVSPSR
jgi:hypothetical protein